MKKTIDDIRIKKVSSKKAEKEFQESVLTADEALALLAPHKEGRKLRVHTYEGAGFALFGCDIDLSILEKRIKACESGDVALSGKNMRGAGHGVALFTEGKGWMFLQSDKKKIDAIFKKRGIK